MPLVALAVDNIIECRVHGLCQNQEVINRFHYRLEEGTPAGPVVTTEDMNNAFIDAWRTNVLAVMLASYGVYQYFTGRITAVAYDVEKEQYKIIYDQQVVEPGDSATDIGGLIVGDQLPVFVAMDLRRRCLITNKNTRGSVRISPHNESHQAQGVWDPARATAVRTAMNALCGPLIGVIGGAVQGRHVVFSPAQASKVGPGPVWAAAASETCVSYQVNTLVSSQTSRKIRAAGY